MGKDNNRVIGEELASRLKSHIDELDPNLDLSQLVSVLEHKGVQLTRHERVVLTAFSSALVRNYINDIAGMKELDPKRAERWRRFGLGKTNFLIELQKKD